MGKVRSTKSVLGSETQEQALSPQMLLSSVSTENLPLVHVTFPPQQGLKLTSTCI